MNPSDLWPSSDSRARWLRLIDIAAPQPAHRVLDVGCGAGRALRLIAEKVGPKGHTVGLEEHPGLSEALLAANREDRRVNPGIAALDPVAGRAEALPFADDSFDLVLCVNVLEAVRNRPGALAELRRVLRPGGRAVVAHDDYEGQIYSCADRELGRRAVRAYAESTFESYAASDGQMGRHLWGLFRAAGFREPRLDVLPLVNTEYRAGLHGHTQAQFSARFVAAVSDLAQEDIDRWHADLQERSDRDEYVYCINLFVCTGRK